MASNRMDRGQFYARLAQLDEAGLKKALWTLYWRGAAPVRERIETVIDPSAPSTTRRAAAPPDPAKIAREVRELAALARAGAYLAGDRRVSPKERTRWRFTFKALATDAVAALGANDVDRAASAVATLVDLAGEMGGYDYFRSDDPIEAARFVVSDAVGVMWSAILREHGFPEFSERAVAQLVRWESASGWTRRGDGWVSQRETTLAQLLEGLIPAGDAWGQFADRYLEALDGAPGGGRAGGSRGPVERAEALSDWHAMLLDRLADGDYEDRLDLIAHHRALAGPERTFLQARLAARDH
ncbi:hypothetical protein [Leekyejoonella antrihumi]|uniref:Uncharacterized protein n=1 Tax=Leekyejoonella antrihumi TaxID=1660198 RepID=A0A563E8B3_9MICO|nr:hypothetical protein [Leekyejoonella antrihumi]TWP38549.1 hypothetical protein FGL98_01790 [Leekyejoonella antrihumi]